jgi:hypothetical protein
MAVRYAWRSPLESMHCATGLAVLKRHNFIGMPRVIVRWCCHCSGWADFGCSLLRTDQLEKSEQKEVRDTMVDMVLATDNATHALHLGELNSKLESDECDMEISADQ